VEFFTQRSCVPSMGCRSGGPSVCSSSVGVVLTSTLGARLSLRAAATSGLESSSTSTCPLAVAACFAVSRETDGFVALIQGPSRDVACIQPSAT
jgi:hypothetical protein